MEENIDILSHFFFFSVNNSICQSNFPLKLQFADVPPAYKKETRNNKTNYHPVNILQNLLKVFENILYKQISEFFENIFSNIKQTFEKDLVQNCLLPMIEKIEIV